MKNNAGYPICAVTNAKWPTVLKQDKTKPTNVLSEALQQLDIRQNSLELLYHTISGITSYYPRVDTFQHFHKDASKFACTGA